MKTPIALILFSILSSSLRAQSISPPPPLTDTGHVAVSDTAYTKVEIESVFPGGLAGWMSYLTQHFRYPKAAVRKRIEGEVVVQFIVDKQGKVTNVQVIKSVHPLLDEEAMRLIRESPNWKPAVQNGKVVKSYKKQPVVFKLLPAGS